MKKNIKFTNSIAAIILLSIIIIGTSCARTKKIEDYKYTSYLDVSIPNGSTILKSKDTHGGFHGDGESYSEIQLTKEGKEKFIDDTNNTKKWMSLPLSDDIKSIVYSDDSHSTTDMTQNIPNGIKNGIYYIRDRFAENYPDEKNKDINSRAAYNVTISILDFDTNKLYVYNLDT